MIFYNSEDLISAPHQFIAQSFEKKYAHTFSQLVERNQPYLFRGKVSAHNV